MRCCRELRLRLRNSMNSFWTGMRRFAPRISPRWAWSKARRVRAASSSFVGQQSLARDVVDLDADAIGILEQHRVVARRPHSRCGRMHDLRAECLNEAVSLVDIAMLARPQAYMMKPDAILHEAFAGMARIAAHDADRRAAAHAIER